MLTYAIGDIHGHLDALIREPFLSVDRDVGKHVVRGHAPTKAGKPEVRQHRTNIDTAAGRGRNLTAGIFTDEQAKAVDFLRVDISGSLKV